jgi:ribosomal protein L24
VTTIDWETPQLGFREKDYPITLDILPNLKDISNEFSWYGRWGTVEEYILEHSEYRSQATIEGLNIAKQEGKKLGRKPKIDDETKSNIIKEKLDGSSLAQIAKKYSISRAGVQHVMRAHNNI